MIYSFNVNSNITCLAIRQISKRRENRTDVISHKISKWISIAQHRVHSNTLNRNTSARATLIWYSQPGPRKIISKCTPTHSAHSGFFRCMPRRALYRQCTEKPLWKSRARRKSEKWKKEASVWWIRLADAIYHERVGRPSDSHSSLNARATRVCVCVQRCERRVARMWMPYIRGYS